MFKNNKGFTLIEMLIVLMIISVLIILIVPNLSGKSKEVNKKGCDALVTVVQAQTDAYYLDKSSYPASLEALEKAGYITKDQKTCPNGKSLELVEDGKVKKPAS